MNKPTIVVIGGGTAGAIASTYTKVYWGDNVEVILIYDHKKPNIGIGESLTPVINSYIDYVGIKKEELIRNVNATVKLGIKFKNWLNDGTEFYHPFVVDELDGKDPFNYAAAYDIVNNQYDYDTCYGKDMFEGCRIPNSDVFNCAYHIDGVLFSKFVLDKFKDTLTVLDDVVEDVVKKPNNKEIDYVVLKSGKKIFGDFFIDASGFSSTLFKALDNEWVDKSDTLPLDSCIPNPVPFDYDTIPVHTTAEATEDGWILQVPVSNRIGTGYLYSSKFTSDEEALSRFSKFLNKRYNTDLNDKFASGPGYGKKILNFKSGYWKKQWNGNCLAIGLSSGFAEPLEATNIHQAIYQIQQFTDTYNFYTTEFDSIQYNKKMESFYERVYLFIGFCYTTKRTDSKFWRYMTDNTPHSVNVLEEKITKDFINSESMINDIFNYNNFTKIAYGLNKIDKSRYEKILHLRNVYNDNTKNVSNNYKKLKVDLYHNSIDHKNYIENIIKGERC